MYYANSIKGLGPGDDGNTFLDVALGTIAGIACLLGLLFLVDRETFAKVTGGGGGPAGTTTTRPEIPVGLRGEDAPERYGSGCRFPAECCYRCCHPFGKNDGARTTATTNCRGGEEEEEAGEDGDDGPAGSGTPYELREAYSPAHLTEETAEYLAEKRKLEGTRWHNLTELWLPCCVVSWGTKTAHRTRAYDDSDKYRGPDAEIAEASEVIDTSTGGGVGSHRRLEYEEDASGKMKAGMRLCVMGAMDAVEEARTRMCPSTRAGQDGGGGGGGGGLCAPSHRQPWTSRCSRPKKRKVFPDIQTDGKDKYHIDDESEDRSIQYKASSYESATSQTTAPW